ncbi:protein of unknown function [Agreia sp. COWG]|nr:protein of unknown function [Agreia sp. COWG]
MPFWPRPTTCATPAETCRSTTTGARPSRRTTTPHPMRRASPSMPSGIRTRPRPADFAAGAIAGIVYSRLRLCLERGRVRPGKLPKRPKGSDCKSAVLDFGGSNPSLATSEKPREREPQAAERGFSPLVLPTPFVRCLRAEPL